MVTNYPKFISIKILLSDQCCHIDNAVLCQILQEILHKLHLFTSSPRPYHHHLQIQCWILLEDRWHNVGRRYTNRVHENRKILEVGLIYQKEKKIRWDINWWWNLKKIKLCKKSEALGCLHISEYVPNWYEGKNTREPKWTLITNVLSK